MSPFNAFLTHFVFVTLLSYTGMYLWLDLLIGGASEPENQKSLKALSAMIASVLFIMLPFYTNMGMSVMGIPLVFYSISVLRSGGKKVAFILIAIFGLSSSLVLSGYFILATMIVLACFDLSLKKRQAGISLLTGCMILLLCYFLGYFQTIKAILFPDGFVSHRMEWTPDILPASQWLTHTLTLFFGGQYHVASFHNLLILFAIAVIIATLLLLRRIEEPDRRTVKRIAAILLTALCIAAVPIVVKSAPFIALLSLFGALGSFQVERLYFAYPFLWYSALGLSLSVIPSLFGAWLRALRPQIPKVVSCVLILSLSLVQLHMIWVGNPGYRDNVTRVATDRNSGVSWRQFYATPLFQEIEAYIAKPQDSYRVVSLGMYPAVPLYNGFYCLDAYSTNYDNSYKEAFREVIAGELEKSDALRTYYDDWGSRCYLFSSELGRKYIWTKAEHKVVSALDIDVPALKQLGCEYIFSAAELAQPPEGVVFERTFSEFESMWQIYLYRIT
jgi:hypothetical protein